MKNKLKFYVNTAHRFLFGSEAGERTVIFAKNIILSFAGGLSAFAIFFAVSIMVARILGPEEYGKYSVVFSFAQILSLFFVFQLDVSTLYFLSPKSYKKSEFISSIIFLFLCNVIIFTFLAWLVYKLFMSANISYIIFGGIIILAFSFAFKSMTDAFLRAKNKFSLQAIFKVLEALTVVIVLVILFFVLKHINYFSYVWALSIGGFVFSVFGVSQIYRNFVLDRITKNTIKTIFRYNIIGVIGTVVGGIIKNIDKIIIVAILGTKIGGIYAVYFMASVTVGSRIIQLFINVFFPTVRSNRIKGEIIFKKINVLFTRTFIPLVFVSSGIVAVIILLYGSQYRFVWLWVVLAGIYIVVHFFASLYNWLLSSISRDGYKKYNLSMVYGAIVYIVVISIIFLAGYFGVASLFMSRIIFRLVSGLISFDNLQKYYKLN